MTWTEAQKAISDKNVEIEQLKAELEHKMTFVALLQDQVRVLKEKNKSITFEYLKAQGEIEDWKENEQRALLLITKLCDALKDIRDRYDVGHGYIDLVQRAWETTR